MYDCYYFTARIFVIQLWHECVYPFLIGDTVFRIYKRIKGFVSIYLHFAYIRIYNSVDIRKHFSQTHPNKCQDNESYCFKKLLLLLVLFFFFGCSLYLFVCLDMSANSTKDSRASFEAPKKKFPRQHSCNWINNKRPFYDETESFTTTM